MATYFVMIPNTELPTAEVGAPDSRHARTTYLDYLSRNNIIEYSNRGRVRGMIITQKMEPGEMQTDLKLDYRVEEPGIEDITGEMSAQGPPQDYERESEEFEPDEEYEYSKRTSPGYEPEQPRTMPSDEAMRREVSPDLTKIYGQSPIMDLSKRTKGM